MCVMYVDGIRITLHPADEHVQFRMADPKLRSIYIVLLKDGNINMT